MEETPNGETTNPAAPSNAPGTSSAPVTDNTTSAELEAARKEAEQAKMRANQLANQLAEREAAEAAAKAKQLEEKEEFKTLYEQTQARLNEIQETQAAQERQAQLSTATQEVFKDYPANVVELAKTAGLALAEDSDEARTTLKGKLDAFQAQVGGTAPKAGANNPRETTPQVVNREEMVARAHPGAESPMAMSMARGDESVTRAYIRELPAIKRMKEIARNGA